MKKFLEVSIDENEKEHTVFLNVNHIMGFARNEDGAGTDLKMSDGETLHAEEDLHVVINRILELEK